MKEGNAWGIVSNVEVVQLYKEKNVINTIKVPADV